MFTARSTKYVPDVKFRLLSSVYYVFTPGTDFADLAVNMYQSHSLKMAL